MRWAIYATAQRAPALSTAAERPPVYVVNRIVVLWHSDGVHTLPAAGPRAHGRLVRPVPCACAAPRLCPSHGVPRRPSARCTATPPASSPNVRPAVPSAFSSSFAFHAARAGAARTALLVMGWAAGTDALEGKGREGGPEAVGQAVGGGCRSG